MKWWRRRKARIDLDEYVAREMDEVRTVVDATLQQEAETRGLRAESSRVHAVSRAIREQNGFTNWVAQAFQIQQEGR